MRPARVESAQEPPAQEPPAQEPPAQASPLPLLRAHTAPSSVTAASSPEALKLKWLSACRRGSYATVQSGIREGWAPVNACDAVGYTALMRCCVSGQMLDLLQLDHLQECFLNR